MTGRYRAEDDPGPSRSAGHGSFDLSYKGAKPKAPEAFDVDMGSSSRSTRYVLYINSSRSSLNDCTFNPGYPEDNPLSNLASQHLELPLLDHH